MNLTPKQAEAIQHRLDADFVADVFEDIENLPFTMEEARHSQDEILQRQVAAKRLDKSEWNDATCAVLVDCIEGSTYAGCCDTDEQAAGAIRTLGNLADKIEGAFGVEIDSSCW